jgi:poly(rC)-binding protein 2/3/4
MDGLHVVIGKRTRKQNEFTKNNDRNKRWNYGSGQEKYFPSADNIVYRILYPSNVVIISIGKGGNNIQNLRSQSGTQILILRKDKLSGCAFSFDELVLISRDETIVKKELYAFSSFMYKHPPKEKVPWGDILPATNQCSLVPSGVPAFPLENYLPQGDSLFSHHNLHALILGYASHLLGLGGYGSEAESAWPLSIK